MAFLGGLIQWIVFIGVGVYFWRKYKAKKAREASGAKDSTVIESEYRKRSEGDSVAFDITPNSAPPFTFLKVLGVIFLLIAVGNLTSDSTWGFVFVFGPMAGVCFWFANKDARPLGHRSPSTFRASSKGIEVNGRTFSREDVHRLILRNPYSSEEIEPGNVVFIQSNLTAIGSQAGANQRARNAAVSYGLVLEAGGKAHLLAGGMNSTTAYGLLHDVCKVIGFGTSG
ncbi:MAG: hypothetical protein ACREF9_14640 [Opitutaceae bacterium]